MTIASQEEDDNFSRPIRGDRSVPKDMRSRAMVIEKVRE